MELSRKITGIKDQLIRVQYYYNPGDYEPSVMIDLPLIEPLPAESSQVNEKEDQTVQFIRNGVCILEERQRRLSKKEIYRYETENSQQSVTKQTANGEVTVTEGEKRIPAGYSYEGFVEFRTDSSHMLLGLGQYEDGIYNYQNHREYLYQSNMKIAMPFLISTAGFGLLVETESSVIFDSREGIFSFQIDTAKTLTYYVILGKDFDEILYGLGKVTGRAVMLPRWALGYIQSKERYESAGELLATANEFRSRNIPIDCLVEDWQSWEADQWGQKTVDKERFPNLPGMVRTLHEQQIRFMISVWPNMNRSCENYREFEKAGLLLPNSNVYDCFCAEGRAMFWKQCREELIAAGIDAFWCDNAEPFSDADWNGEIKRPESLRYEIVVEESRKHMDWERLNSYGLYHARGLYENWRDSGIDKRMVNLTRSGYLSQQKYGVITWSGDISARWDVLRRQITEGIKTGLCGVPYWTLDIGGFFVLRENWQKRGCNCKDNPQMLWFWNGDFEEGVRDLGYRELYTRWIQLGVFLPVFRSHGTDTPREPWNFGEPGDRFYDVIVKYIRLRYLILPYLYSCTYQVNRSNRVIMRSLLFDFIEDEKVWNVADCYMFGPSFLVCPVTFPMYYDRNSKPLSGVAKIRKVYLPKGAGWYDFWTNTYYKGGRDIQADADLEILPLFVRAGSIIPVSEEVTYADEKMGETGEIRIYDGADGEFVLYNDEGDNYSYERGNYSAIHLNFQWREKKLTLSQAEGLFPHQTNFCINLILREGTQKKFRIEYLGFEKVYNLQP